MNDTLMMDDTQMMPMMPMMMFMSFYQTSEVTLLFHHFGSEEGETGKYIGLCILVAVLAFSIECFAYFRYKIMKQYVANEEEISVKNRLTVTLSYMFSVIMSYLVMLCVMSYNVGIFISAIVGLTSSHFIFSFLKRSAAKNLDYYTTDYNALVGGENKPLLNQVSVK